MSSTEINEESKRTVTTTERNDLREVKEDLVRRITVQQREMGAPLPRPDLATKMVEDLKIIEDVERTTPENKQRFEAATENEHTPDIEREIFDVGEAMRRVQQRTGKNVDLRQWLAFVQEIDPQFKADLQHLTKTGLHIDAATNRPFFPRKTFEQLRKLLAKALDKYGDPRVPNPRIQVGGAPATKEK